MNTNTNTNTNIRELPVWFPENKAISFTSESEHYWLTDKNSLTSKLEHFYNAEIKVNLLQQALGVPDETELQALDATDNQQFIVRRVQLVLNNVPRIYARSIFPNNNLYFRQNISLAAHTPIGKWLFAHPEIDRSTFEITRIHSKQLEEDAGAPSGQQIWGRRSVFSFRSQSALVTEYFLTPI